MATSPLPGPTDILLSSPSNTYQPDSMSQQRASHASMKPNQVGQVILYGIPIVSLVIDGQERLCLAQISNTLLKNFSYNEIHNRRVALGITCVQCTPVQLEILRRAGAMPISSRRCGMITKREAERLCKSFLGENRPPKLPDNFAFDVSHECAWGCRGSFIPARYNSSRAKCIKCSYCSMYFSPNKFIFHSHRTPEANCSYPSEESSEEEEEEEEDEEEEQEVDVEGHKQPEEEEGDQGVDALGGSSRYLQSRGLTEKGGGSRDRAAATGLFSVNSSRQQQEEKLGDTSAELHPPPPGPQKGGNSSSSSSPVHHPSLEEQPSYKDVNIPFRLLPANYYY
ncbi:SKI family transcriptional corepressor 2 [Chelonia mydas]|uniref:SKI family transcriptional corepressor 2 n=1 Tax=Chelonia mydas TaxID=8469 RepID=M7CGS1_CHEMY|nr:SKI family transcriptional corepressor 2 [Chelonia mydas]